LKVTCIIEKVPVTEPKVSSMYRQKPAIIPYFEPVHPFTSSEPVFYRVAHKLLTHLSPCHHKHKCSTSRSC